MERKLRILIAKPGLDGHDRGAKVIARALRDAGMEVIYTGLRQTPEQIVNAALQEDVDAIGVSILSGAHMTLLPKIVNLAREKGLDDVLIFCGGIIPDEDIPKLKAAGVAEVFTPGTSTEETIRFLQEHVRPRIPR
ncbi:MAG: cobalamin B12-binding domain-containing protein [Acidobacteriota bacterium]|nr:cobalamin B12-binding domain-containing protein [Blastocatellia bacterium]MDW8411390.1 cobalamin B12-binding domain-containing protein [Acidobacteriota bacterium]